MENDHQRQTHSRNCHGFRTSLINQHQNKNTMSLIIRLWLLEARDLCTDGFKTGSLCEPRPWWESILYYVNMRSHDVLESNANISLRNCCKNMYARPPSPHHIRTRPPPPAIHRQSVIFRFVFLGQSAKTYGATTCGHPPPEGS